MSEPPLSPEQRTARRRRLAEVFGDVLPDQTSDDQSVDDHVPGDGPVPDDRTDAWLRAQVPPHHGPSRHG